MQTITVYSHNIQIVREVTGALSALGKQGIVFVGNEYESSIEYLFTRLNEVKPEMIEDATRKAREVAEIFAADSKITLEKSNKRNREDLALVLEIKIIHTLKRCGSFRR